MNVYIKRNRLTDLGKKLVVTKEGRDKFSVQE